MTPTRRISLLNLFAAAGTRGLTMAESRYCFTSQDVAELNGLVERLPGNEGIYRITTEGQRYLNVREDAAA